MTAANDNAEPLTPEELSELCDPSADHALTAEERATQVNHDLVRAELGRIYAKRGHGAVDLRNLAGILGEEFGEAIQASNDVIHGGPRTAADVVDELVQVQAVVRRWLTMCPMLRAELLSREGKQ